MKHQKQCAVQARPPISKSVWEQGSLQDAWTSAAEKLEQLGFAYAVCVLRHGQLPTGQWVMRSQAALASMGSLVSLELQHAIHPGGFAVLLGAGTAEQKAGWVIEQADKGARVRPERKVEAKRLAVQAYAQFMRILDEQLEPDVHPKHLSAREKECLSLLAQGLRTKKIAERIAISPATVEFHFKNARRKLGALTREQALAISIHNGWVQV